MILFILAVLAVAFFIIMIFIKPSVFRKYAAITTGTLLVIGVALVAATMLTGFGFTRTTKHTMEPLTAQTKITKQGSGSQYSVLVKDSGGHKRTFTNKGSNSVTLKKGYAAYIDLTQTTQRANNGFFTFLYQYTGMNKQTLVTKAKIMTESWQTSK